jgi:hypothetical protein
VPVADDRQVVARRPQVLPDRQHLDAVLAQRAERVEQLLARLAEAGHQAGLRHDLALAELARVMQDAARAQEVGAAAGERVEARDRLDVVVEDVGPLGDDPRQRHLLAAEVGREQLDPAIGREAADRPDDADEGRGAEVRQVVAIDARDDGVPQAHPLHRLRDPERLERVVVGRLAGLDVAEAAAARAGVAEDHERRGAALPAFADVRARGLAADRVQALVLDQRAQLAVVRAAGRGALEPGRLAVAERPHLAELEHAGAAGVRARAGGHAGTDSTRAGAAAGRSPSRRPGVTTRWRRPSAWATR